MSHQHVTATHLHDGFGVSGNFARRLWEPNRISVAFKVHAFGPVCFGPVSKNLLFQSVHPFGFLDGPFFPTGDYWPWRGFGDEPFLDGGVALIGGKFFEDPQFLWSES